jgi:hypothetical protein
MADEQQEQPQQQLQQQHSADMKLPPFWPARPRAWFTYVEGRFRLRNVTDQQHRFDLVLSALPSDIVTQVLDIIEEAPEAAPYDYFKQQLLRTHQLSDYEKFDRLVKMEPMGGRKPSQLLHDMMEFCPAGMEKTLPFHYFFTQRLPQSLRTQLSEVQPGDPRALAERADTLWVAHSSGGSVSAVEVSEEPAAVVAAATSSYRGRGGRGVQRGASRGRGGARAPAAPTAAADPTPSDLARLSSGLCFFHWTWAEKAKKCAPPCTWGN